MDDLGFGLEITVVGMGIVFGVLILLWGLLTLALRLESRRARGGSRDDAGAPGPVAVVAPGGVVRLVGTPGDLDPALVAAVTVAVLRHTEALRLQAAPSMRSYWPGSLLFASRWVAAGRTRQGQSWRRRR
jgi:Na+-transporting methylmalonyl-CoA/oxaloacetate decarboxylase gamma subunit